MGKSSPPAPDYVGAAQAQGQQSQQLALNQNYANRPSVITPWGSQTWQTQSATDPSTGQPVTSWTSNINLSPQQQQALDSQFRIQQGRSGAAEQLLTQATDAFSTPFSWGGLPERGQNVQAVNLGQSGMPSGQVTNRSFDTGSAVERFSPMSFGPVSGAPSGNYGATTDLGNTGSVRTQLNPSGQIQGQIDGSANDWRDRAESAVWARMQPELQQRRAATENQLANMGLSRGSEAWNREMMALNDAEDRARLNAIESGRAEAGQLFGQELSRGTFANNAQSQQFGQNLQSGAFENDAQGRVFQQALGRGQFFNQGQNQNLQTDMALTGFDNQAQAQRFAQGVQATGINNQAQAQEFGQNLGLATFENQASQQEFQNLMQLALAGDQRAMQQLQMQIQAGNFNNNNRASAIAEQTQRRQMPLNELNALLTGQLVGQPQFNPGGTGAAVSGQPTDILGALQQQYGSAIDAANMRNNNINQLGALASSMFSFSDLRLKRNISTRGLLSTGVRVVDYQYVGLPGWHTGVIAQELAEVQPEAVLTDASGYLLVDYSKVRQ